MKTIQPRRGAIAFCSRKEPGLILSETPVEVEYGNGEKGIAWTGIHLSLAKFGQPWSSRTPQVVGVIRPDMFSSDNTGIVIEGRGTSRALLYL